MGGKAPKIPIVKTTDYAAMQAEKEAAAKAKAQAEELERLKTQRGRGATLLTSGQGVTGNDSSMAVRKMLGG